MSRTVRSGNHARPHREEMKREQNPSQLEEILRQTDYNALRKTAKERGLEFDDPPTKEELVEALAGS